MRVLPRFLLAVVAGLFAALAVAAPAAAHGGEAPNGTNYRTAVTGVTPATPGLTVRVIEAGARLELTNRTGRPIEVLGYSGEPYLDVRPDGVYENVRSPATYLNQTLAGGVVPPQADPTLPPQWRRIADGPTVRWHDQRARWLAQAPPVEALAAGREHRLQDWAVPLRDGTTSVRVTGTLHWLPPPDPLPWWSAALLGSVAIGALGVAPAGRRMVTLLLALLAAAGGGAVVALAVARQLDAGAAGPGGIASGLLSTGVWTLLAGLGALASAAYAVARRPATDFSFALAGACLALFGGVTNAWAFTRSVVPLPWPAVTARVVVATVIAVGAGVALAGVLRLRAAAAAAAVPGEESHGPLADPVPR